MRLILFNVLRNGFNAKTRYAAFFSITYPTTIHQSMKSCMHFTFGRVESSRFAYYTYTRTCYTPCSCTLLIHSPISLSPILYPRPPIHTPVYSSTSLGRQRSAHTHSAARVLTRAQCSIYICIGTRLFSEPAYIHVYIRRRREKQYAYTYGRRTTLHQCSPGSSHARLCLVCVLYFLCRGPRAISFSLAPELLERHGV